MKRVEREGEAMFDRLVAWIHAQNGYVHESIRFCSQRRELLVADNIPEGTVLLKLPQSAVVNRPFLPDSYQELYVELKKEGQFQENGEDISLAMYMANQPSEIKPYLDSLPGVGFLRTLPAHWESEDLSRLLQGSPLLKTVLESKHKLEKDYELVKQVVSRLCTSLPNGGNNIAVPSVEVFSLAMALVESRAFALDGMVDSNTIPVSAMIPLLDLCDHRRGSHNGVQKNVSYCFQEGSVLVRSVRNVNAGKVLRITYGAKSNSLLLLKYGFCLQDNVEPDGSSNDVLMFEAIPNTEGLHSPVSLRTGPKSYTFGKFVTALGFFLNEPKLADEEPTTDFDDLNAFLDECNEATEESEGFEWEDSDWEDSPDPLPAERVSAEIEALWKFETRLLQVATGYGTRSIEIQKTLSSPAASRDFYCAVLLRSELRTILFFLLAVRRVRNRLQRTTDTEDFKSVIQVDSNDLTLIIDQVEEMAQGYMLIRHPNW